MTSQIFDYFQQNNLFDRAPDEAFQHMNTRSDSSSRFHIRLVKKFCLVKANFVKTKETQSSCIWQYELFMIVAQIYPVDVRKIVLIDLQAKRFVIFGSMKRDYLSSQTNNMLINNEVCEMKIYPSGKCLRILHDLDVLLNYLLEYVQEE